MTICDANYCFHYIDVGNYGSNNYSSALLNSNVGQMIQLNSINNPEPSNLPRFNEGHIFLAWGQKPNSKAALANK